MTKTDTSKEAVATIAKAITVAVSEAADLGPDNQITADQEDGRVFAETLRALAAERDTLQATVDDLTEKNQLKVDYIEGLINTSAAQDQKIFELKATVKEMREALEGGDVLRSVITRLDSLRTYYVIDCGPDYSEVKKITLEIDRIKKALAKHKEQDHE